MEQIGHPQTSRHCCDKDIHPFVDTLITDDLNPKQLLGLAIGNGLDHHLLATIVFRLVGLDVVADHNVVTTVAGLFFIEATGGNRPVEELENACPRDAAELEAATGDGITGNSAHFVGCGTEWTVNRPAIDDRETLSAITTSIDIRDIGLHPGVDGNRPGLTQGHPHRLGESRVRPDSDRQDHQVGIDRRTIVEIDRSRPDFGRSNARQNRDMLLDQGFFDVRGQIRINKGTDLGQLFHHGHQDTSVDQVFDHLEANEPTADDNCGFGLMFLDIGSDRAGRKRISEGEDMRQINPGDRRHNRGRSGGQDQDIIAVREGLTCDKIFNHQGLGCRIYGKDFVPDQDLHLVLVAEKFRIARCQFFELGDFAADVVGQAAAGV